MPLPALITAAVAVTTALAPATALAAAPQAAPAAVSPAAASAAVRWTSYTVRAGDTLTFIARRTGTTTGVLVAANHLTAGGHLLRIGQRIIVPTSPTRTAPVSTAPAPRATTPTKTPSAKSPTSRAAVRALIVSTAQAHGVDPQLAIAIGYQESGWTQSARSSVGAIGVMQVMPANQAWLSGIAGRNLDLTTTQDNVLGGVLLLKVLVRQAPSLDYAIGGYYQGLPSLQRRGPYPDTTRYIASVKALMARL